MTNLIPRFQCLALLAFLGALGAIRVSGFPEAGAAQMSARAFAITPAQENHGRTRVAEGEYQVLEAENDQAIGSYVPGVFDFRESWTLWRLADGTFVVEGERRYESPIGERHNNPFSVRLSKDFSVLGMTDFRKLDWQPDSGPLKCEFEPAELLCSSGAKNPNNEISLNVPMKAAYGLLWPISAFSLSNITRHAARTSGKMTPVQLVTAEEQNKQNPVFVSVLDGHLKYLGREEIQIAGRNWRADKFQLKVPLRPPFLIWTSPEGLLLRFAPESGAASKPESGMILAHFAQSANF